MRQVQEKPVVLQWMDKADVGSSSMIEDSNFISVNNPSGVYDIYDVQKEHEAQNLNNDENINEKQSPATTSYGSYTSYRKQQIDNFFYDDPLLPWQPLPAHTLEESPCYPIIDKNEKFYRCRIHPVVQNIHLDSIERHCKYKEPARHKSEILNLLEATPNKLGSQ